MAFSCIDVSPCRPELWISLSKWKISPGEATTAELKPPKNSSAEQLRSNQLTTLCPGTVRMLGRDHIEVSTCYGRCSSFRW